ncbi:hypothetical protein MM236_07815 [Belliella sp. DSM 107340]|uniref:Lipoprotein n=1 Tax=Belliella calami TaxID=2923436 RepID=A0ABS9UNB2_9BACT|nr:hypothetical protein [Belliella calami]MCH7397890.1 hypothetical protein [Belliella calami]
MIKNTSFIFFLAFLLSCQPENTNKEDFDPPYFRLQEFIENQAESLVGKQLAKEIQFNTSKEIVDINPTEEEWLEELDFFMQADINRPSLAQAYFIEKSENEISYSLKKGEKSKVKFLKVQFYEPEKPKTIEFLIGSENTFYSSNTEGWLEVDENTNLVTKFEVKGEQKVVFLDPIIMDLNGQVNN